MTLSEAIDFISQIGVVGILLLFITGLLKEWWVMGVRYREKATENTQWKDIALRWLAVQEKLVEYIEGLGKRRP